MKRRHKRAAAILASIAGIAIAVGLALSVFNENLVFFFTPSQVAANESPQGRAFRIGGLVEEGSLHRAAGDAEGLTWRFTVTDTLQRLPVVYTGILPDLFKEGSGAVAQGRLGDDGTFYADQVLAKHDENYMPVEIPGTTSDAGLAPGEAGKLADKLPDSP